MAIGRIGTTPTLRTRWSKQPSGGTTSLSGLDDNSVSLVYDVGYEAVYRNGVLLSRTNDYTATSGTSITLIDATIAGDVIEVFANQSIPLTDTYTQTVADGKFINNTLVDAKGDILTATADNTPARLAVGSNDQVLTADSSTATGLKWATPAAGGMTLLSTTTLSGTTTTISGISGSYNDLAIIIYGVNFSAVGRLQLSPNNEGFITQNICQTGNAAATSSQFVVNQNKFRLDGNINWTNGNTNNAVMIEIKNYASTASFKPAYSVGQYESSTPQRTYFINGHIIETTSAITSLVFTNHNGATFNAGTVLLYGVK